MKIILKIKVFFFTPVNLFVVLFLFAVNLSAQSYIYDAGSSIEDEAMGVSADANGNIYTTGYFGGHCDFSDGFALNSSGASDIFLLKTTPSGYVAWVAQAGGYGEDRGLSVVTDAGGNSYVTGYFTASADFGTQTLTSAGGQDVFIAKYNVAGNLVWVVQAGGSGMDIANKIILDNNGNLVITGQFLGTSVFGTTTITSLVDPQTSQNVSNIFIAKYDTSGNFVWVKQGMSDKDCRGITMTADNAGNIYGTGQFSDTLQFDVVHNNDMYNSIYLIKLDASGNEQWFKKIGGSLNNLVYDITTDNSNHILLTGEAHGTVHFFDNSGFILTNTYEYQAFTAKFDFGGNLLWARSDGSSSEVSPRAICVNDNDAVFIGGTFKCRFSEYADVYGQGTFNSIGYNDIFVTKYDENGQRQWMRNYGGKKQDFLHDMVMVDTVMPVMVGSFRNILVMPVTLTPVYNNHEVLYSYGIYEVNYGVAHCGDNSYWRFSELNNYGAADIFITNAIDLNRSPYDYYKRTGTGCNRPYVGCCIGDAYSSDMTCTNSVEACDHATICACSNTSSTYDYGFTTYSQGPNFNYQWSAGSAVRCLSVYNSGTYSVTVTSEDGCFQSADSIDVVIHPLPEVPWISDNLGFGTNSPTPYSITICGDSVELTGSNITTNNYYWIGPGIGQVYDSVITATISGQYYFHVIDSFGCTSGNYVTVNFQETIPEVQPYLMDIIDSISGDTIFICHGEDVTIHMFDSISDLPHILPCNQVLAGDHHWSSVPSVPNNICCNCMGFYIDTSGYYTFTDTLIRANACDTDIVSADITYFVNVFPSPDVDLNISGAGHFCPGDSVWLSVCCADEYYWHSSGGGGFVGNPEDDSILVWNPGNFYVWGWVENAYGCRDSTVVGQNVSYWGSPPIIMLPASGVICPGDSVSLSIVDTSVINYQWQGPTGQISSDSSTIFVSTPGYYNCIVTYPGGCNITSNTVEVKQYMTPFLVVSPSTFICNGDSAQICLVANLGSNYQWGPPITNNDSCQLIFDAGTYTCQVTSCGITTNLNTVIEVDDPVVNISALGPTTFCSGDFVQLQATVGMQVYNWMPYGQSSDIITVTEQGDYYVMIIDNYNCPATSNIITVTVNTVESPVAEGDTICYGQNTTLIASGTDNYNWVIAADTSLSPFLTDSFFVTPALYGDTTFYVYSQNLPCHSDFVPVTVVVLDSVPSLTPQLTSNSPVCESDSLVVVASVPQGSIYHWSGPSGFSSGDSILVLTGLSSQYAGTYFLYIENDGCLSYQSSIPVIIFPLPQTNVTGDTGICSGESVQLNATGNYSFYWQPANGLSSVNISNPVALPDSTTTYYCIATDNTTGCVDTTQVTIQVHRHPYGTMLQLDTTIVIGDEVNLNNFDNTSGLIFNWSPDNYISCTQCSCPVAKPEETIEYFAYYEDSIGCRFDIIDYLINVDYKYSVDVPNSFTPNGDDKNDIVYVKGWGIKDLLEFDIYNRWGQKIFYTNDLKAGWDGTYKGKPQNIDSYVYYVKVRFYNGIEKEKKGTINLFR